MIQLIITILILLPISYFVVQKCWNLWHEGERQKEENLIRDIVEGVLQTDKDVKVLRKVDTKKVLSNLNEIKTKKDLGKKMK